MTTASLYMVDNCLLARISKKRFLEKANFNISGDFSSISDCILAMEKNQADVILIDSDLLDTNVYKEIELLKRINPKVKIIITSSFLNDFNPSNALCDGVSAYVLKEKEVIDYKEIIENVVHGEFHMDIETATEVFDNTTAEKEENFKNIPEKDNFESSLTQRELEVLKLMIDGKTNSQIAQEIIISTNTAKAHVGNILTKLSVTDRVQAVVKAVRANIFEEKCF
ncbi:MAG: response regulator transcription factor [Candidatus Gastranaerophilales bacterium]|nr:response regulator transcription factor [Candidatus Gastranaerophilales bacterium]